MATLTVNREVVLTGGREQNERWEKVKNFFRSISDMVSTYFAAGNLDYLDGAYTTSLTAKERAVIDGDLMGITPF